MKLNTQLNQNAKEFQVQPERPIDAQHLNTSTLSNQNLQGGLNSSALHHSVSESTAQVKKIMISDQLNLSTNSLSKQLGAQVPKTDANDPKLQEQSEQATLQQALFQGSMGGTGGLDSQTFQYPFQQPPVGALGQTPAQPSFSQQQFSKTFNTESIQSQPFFPKF
mmetsp:Transcript_8848/g.15002  ORF Transcript_8848/g.15002 Transcript_8848/m.15002 type:complete len:165 (-) Transcript_8848:427-921(-)